MDKKATKAEIKAQIRAMKKERDVAIEAKDKKKLHQSRRKLHRLRRRLRLAIHVAS